MAFLEICGDKINVEMLEQGIKEGYAIFHRELGKAYSRLSNFYETEGRYPTVYDFAITLGMRDVADKIEDMLEEKK